MDHNLLNIYNHVFELISFDNSSNRHFQMHDKYQLIDQLLKQIVYMIFIDDESNRRNVFVEQLIYDKLTK
jgi:hypothetical protein